MSNSEATISVSVCQRLLMGQQQTWSRKGARSALAHSWLSSENDSTGPPPGHQAAALLQQSNVPGQPRVPLCKDLNP